MNDQIIINWGGKTERKGGGQVLKNVRGQHQVGRFNKGDTDPHKCLNCGPPDQLTGLLSKDQEVSLQPGWGHSGLCHPPSQTDGRTGRQLPLRPLHIMEALYIQPFEEDRRMEQEEGGMEASTPTGSTTDEETDEDSEREPPPVVRRKVSFADAFGLNLVSVKEFDNVDVTESEVSEPTEREATHPLEEIYMSRLFTVPSSPEELDQSLQAQMVELESIELLPGTTTLRGTVRVVNLCYSKSVYARITLDRWNTYFDLMAEYVPGSSDMKTDKFTFMYTLVPPFEKQGTRMEFCLRYDTSVGTFWANNKEMNYVLFCHQKGQGPQVQEESTGHKGKRSCLKANRRGSAEEKTREIINTATVAAEVQAAHEAEEADRKTVDSAEIQSLLYHEEHKPLVDSVKSRHRAARLARVQDFFSQRRQQVPKPKPMPSTWDDAASSLETRQKKPSNESLQVLTYHQIPLLTLDWNNDKPQQWGTADVDDIWTGRDKMSKASEEHMKDTPSVNDIWETFHNGTDNTTNKETSVCDVWQAFLNGPSCKDHSGVPESEWLQTAASVSPPNDKEPQTQYGASSQEHEFQVGTDIPTILQAPTSAACQLLSDTRETLLANVALNAEDQQPAEACVGSPRDDNTVTQDASQRSQTNSVTDTLQEFSFIGATPVSEGSVDSSTECHELVIWEREREGIIGEAGGIGGNEPSMPHTADLVTSSGESETTDMTAMPESQNATAGDRISQGARLDEGLSYSREGEVTGTAHNAMAFSETISQGTKDWERFVFSVSRQGAEEGITTNCTENKVSTEEEIFRPECEISQGYADEKQCEEFKPNQNRENALKQNDKDENEIRPAQSHADEFNLNQTYVDGFGQKEVETSDCTTSEKTKTLIGEAEVIRLLDEEAEAELGFQKEEAEDPTQTQTEKNGALKPETDEHVSVSNQTDEGISLSCSGIIQEKQVLQNDHDTFRPSPTDKCNPNPMEVLETGWTHSQEHMKGQEEDVGSEISTREVTVKENIGKKDTSTELQHQPETLKRIEEDMSQRDRAERVSIGKLEIEAVEELMGNMENPQGESENAPAEVKEQELSAEVESSPHVEYKKLSEGTKDPITAENTVALEVIESGLEEMFIDRFGEDLVSGIWEDVFGQRGNVQASNRGTNIAKRVGGRLTDILDITHDCHLLSDEDYNETFDSGVFSLTELPTDPNLNLYQGLEQTLTKRSNEFSPTETGQSLAQTEQTHFLSKLQIDSDSSAHLSQDLKPTLAAQRKQSSTESAQTLSSPKDQGNHTQIKERSVTRQETGSQIEDCVLAHRESFNQSGHPSPEHSSPSSKKLKESDGLLWWSILYILSHITRVLICSLLVAGFFVIVLLCDFPAFFALYISSLCWWFYKCKRHRGTMNKVG
ncbi:uncharacterized protein ppp1r3aa isoform X1 [Thunnus maccoyii]|uniref:uncharacterized protein ppp1r3aa isoform X1 n=1 Tax=Thunnus maccoyii TaxID=8240 RepID=UPI001C4A8011|nr:uncharacterized protein ppp1r3aa isoform X1 [Thunnus maccoyii]